MRGEFHDYYGFAGLMPTFNPLYLLRNPTKKCEIREEYKARGRAALAESKS